MWPNLFGPGWVWGVADAAAALAACAGMVLLVARPDAAASPGRDPLLEAWRRRDEGDLTRPEFERLRAALAGGRGPSRAAPAPRATSARRRPSRAA